MSTNRVWWLVRGIDKAQSFLFPVQVTVEEDEPNLYGAAVQGMEEHMAAMGRTASEAERNALDLFKAVVDDALDRKASLAVVLGKDFGYHIANFPVTQAATFFSAIHDLETLHDSDEWQGVPVALIAFQKPEHSAVE